MNNRSNTIKKLLGIKPYSEKLPVYLVSPLYQPDNHKTPKPLNTAAGSNAFCLVRKILISTGLLSLNAIAP